jgi:hypothetical protein
MSAETETHSPEQRPESVGVYRRTWNEYERFSYWNGIFWGVLVNTAERAIEYQHQKSSEQNLPWSELGVAV